MEQARLDMTSAGTEEDGGFRSAGGPATEWTVPPDDYRVLDQNEIDRLLGYNPHELATAATGSRGMADASAVAYERLPVLEAILERLAGLLSTSLRAFLQATVETRITGTSSVRLGDYLDSVPLPAQVAIFRADGWQGGGLLTVSSGLAYASFDGLLGGKRGPGTARFDGRPFTGLETQLIKGLVGVVLSDVETAFGALSPVQLALDRLEGDPRQATVGPPGNAAVLARFRFEMEGRGGDLDLVLPYASLETIRGLLARTSVGESLARDRVWESTLR